jgi:hypothetical protein
LICELAIVTAPPTCKLPVIAAGVVPDKVVKSITDPPPEGVAPTTGDAMIESPIKEKALENVTVTGEVEVKETYKSTYAPPPGALDTSTFVTDPQFDPKFARLTDSEYGP